MPARRAHELCGLHDIVFDLQRRDDLERARAHFCIEISYRSRFRHGCMSVRRHCLMIMRRSYSRGSRCLSNHHAQGISSHVRRVPIASLFVVGGAGPKTARA